MKKATLIFILTCTTLEIKPMHSGGTIAGAAIAGFVGGFILGKLLPIKKKKNFNKTRTKKNKALKNQY